MTNRAQEKGLIPLVAVSAIVAAPLLVIIGIVIGSQIQLSNFLSSDSLSSWISAAATVAIAVLTFVLAKETWYLREAQIEQVNELRRESIRPNVSIALTNSPISFNLMVVEVSNLGRGIARNIRFGFFDKSGSPINAGEDSIVDEFLKLHILSEGMHTLGIGQKVSSFVFSFFDLKGKVKGGDIFSPFFTIAISYEDTEGTPYTNELTVDFAEFKGISELGGGDPLYNISNDIKKLREKFEQVTGISSKRIHVEVYTAEDREREQRERDEWLTEQRKKAEEGANNEIQPTTNAAAD
ncbi:hypothetical protein [Thauera aromatica]|uniref:hypothetical protein n=1 Tax=Thauera aromatica TaxID=59405 RepID=UPI001FFC7D93|nr:hypothetical protein [Thauera aromatica]MCK2094658.1 hypothetical protein [Thauera aromatica]